MKSKLSILLVLLSLTAMSQNQYLAEWRKVDSLTGLGQSQSALDAVTLIYDKAKASNQAEQFLKASLFRMKLESEFQEDYFETSITRTQNDIQSAQPPVKQILHSILAELYWRYYENNRWQILSRSETSGFLPDDIKTWDFKKLVTASIENYTLSLENKDLLISTPLSAIDEILVKQKDSQKLRPTLYDFLAHRAIDFYSSTEAGLTKPANTFLLDQPTYFAPSNDFAALSITSQDLFSFEFQALKLYREIIAIHLPDKDPEALVNADIERLSFVHEKSIMPEKDSLYLAALFKLESRFKNHPSSTEVAYEIALQLNNDPVEITPYNYDEKGSGQPGPDVHKWDKKQAIDICDAAINRFPESFGAKNCKSLIESIKQSSLSVTTNYASAPGKPTLALVNYRNVSNMYFRLIRMDAETDRELMQNQQDLRLGKYLAMKPEMIWSQPLPDDGDFRNHSAEIRLPAVAAGYYVLLSSTDASFPSKSAIISSNSFWGSQISFISRRDNAGNNEIVVLNRQSGEPMAGIKVQAFYREYNPNLRKYENNSYGTYVTDKAGMVIIAAQSDNNRYKQFYLVFNSKSDQLISESYFSSYPTRNNEPKTVVSTHFFTDRAIYRPGQTIYFKGIVLERKGEDVKIKPGFSTEVSFYDVNGQVVSKQNLVTNDFGSFSGNFTVPQGVLTGTMTLRCETGSVSVQVEEYKRPKFEVTFEPVKGSYKLGETITITGKAIAYAGSTVSEAKVTYRVVRQARFPFWWGWRSRPTSAEMEITNGETVTAVDGSFSVVFKAIPDQTIDRKTDPVFTFTVYADVSDINGESHSSETGISVGYKALLVSTDLADDINLEKELKFSLTTTNLNGEKEATSGIITISKLRQPDQVLYSRKWKHPDRYAMTKAEFEKDFPGEVFKDEDDVTTWSKEVNPVSKDSSIFKITFQSPKDSTFSVGSALEPGMYVIEIRTKDAFGQEVVYKKYFNTFQPRSGKSEASSPAFFTLLTPTVEPGQDVKFVIGTPVKNAYIIYEVIHKDKVVSHEILNLSKEQKIISIPVTEEFRGGFNISLAFVKNNRSFLVGRVIDVPYTNKKLDISFSTFRSKLFPGQEEEWQLTLRDSKGEKTAAEMLASMYDASLDAFVPHSWSFSIFNSFYGSSSWSDNQCFGTEPGNQFYYPEITEYPSAHEYDQLNWFGFNFGFSRGLYQIGGVKSTMTMTMGDQAMPAVTELKADEVSKGNREYEKSLASNSINSEGSQLITEKPGEHKPIQMRKDFNETAFFFPQLATNENGEILIKFKAPEALTRWKMMGLAYTKDLKYGQVEKTLVTQKDMMIFTNPPRFLREGDTLEFSAKISNIGESDFSGTAELHFFDALTMKPVDGVLGLPQSNILFSVGKGQSSPVSWKISIPEGLQALVYRITSTAGNFSDGEEAAVPVLTNRMLVTESMPLPVNGMQQKKFNFEKLVNSGKPGSTLRNYRLSLEFTSNPAWYAVQALPYLMEYPYECAEQIFSRYYANSLATHIANSDPKIKRVFESWKTITPDALKSNLEKNEELKSVLLQESPWVREATNESERKQRIALLFDLNWMASEQNAALKKLREMQSPNGGWSWFKGMPESRYITQHIVTGLGHLAHLEVINPLENSETYTMLKQALEFLDLEIKTSFEKLKKDDKNYLKNNHLGFEDIQYLYARSYFLKDYPPGNEFTEMLQYYSAQSIAYWKSQNNYMKAMIALYLSRSGEQNTALLIMRSLKETALHNDETGMYWRNEQHGWNWYQAPVETQALLIEAFDKVSDDQKSVEEMKIWLLKQKQTQDWKTTKATSEAIYALLLRGTSLLASDKQVEITLGTEKVNPYKTDGSKPEAGTGYFKTSWEASVIKPEMGRVTVSNPNPSVAWGAMYWQYFEQLDKITAAESPLSLSKKLFRERNTPAGPVIEPITGTMPVETGDKIIVRVELRSDRDMEYIHLKDMRASSFEPVNVLSGYRYQDGLGYYESTRDASTNFFIYYLPKGTYVFEYKLVATQKGDFSNGITSVQCMYAPEFAAHSEGIRVKVE